MGELFLSMALIAAAGAAVRPLIRRVAEPDALRKSISTIVLYVLLPALVFAAAYRVDLSGETIELAKIMTMSAGACVVLGLFVFSFLSLDGRVKGALILAGAFGSLACLGLPASRDLLGTPVEAVALPANLAVTLLLVTAGSALAFWFAEGRKNSMTVVKSAAAMVRLPPVWAAAAALALRHYDVVIPDWALDSARTLGMCVAGLMMLNLGMALRVPEARNVGWILPALAVKLAAAPLAVYFAARLLDTGTGLQADAAVEAAMPTQLLVLAIADRFDLDAGTTALAAAASTALAYLTIPVVRSLVG